MTTQTHFYGPLEITDYGNGAADVFRCEVTIDGVTHQHVATLTRVGKQWQVIRELVVAGWVRRNAWMRWEALQAHGETYVLVACEDTFESAVEAVLGTVS